MRVRMQGVGLISPVTHMDFSQLGPYDIGERIGKGGMGLVYRGTNRETGDVAAIKVLAPQLALSEGFRERFEAEIESLKTLRHENIVRLFGYGKDSGALFYAMQLVNGTSLDEQIKSGRRFDWHETVDIALQVCRALKHAHDHGIIHRDIKPANILIEQSGAIKIADFGIARLFGGNQLTVAGGVLGTADYMSPEQAEGAVINEKADQYSLGCVMFALLAGRPPFRARNLPEMLQLQRYAEPEPVTRYAPSTPPQLSAAIAQMLEKDADKRFPNILVLSRHLEALKRALSMKELADAADVSGVASDAAVDNDAALAATRADVRLDPNDLAESSFDVSASVDVDELGREADSDATVARRLGTSRQRNTIFASEGDEFGDPDATEFTTVDLDRSGNHAVSTVSQILPLTLLLLTLLAAAAGGVWWLSQPADATTLLATIDQAANNNDLKRVEGQMREFLTRFPHDPRRAEVAGLLNEVELMQRNRRFDLLARRGNNAEDLTPIERLYVDAVRRVGDQPLESISSLEALVVLGESVDEIDSRDEICLELARQKLAELKVATDAEAAQQREFIDTIIAQIETLEVEQRPQAKASAAAFVRLYGDKPWAADHVARAQKVLEQESGEAQ